MNATAVVIDKPTQVGLKRLELDHPTDHDLVIDIAFSGISTGTERLIWAGDMPSFPGMGYPLVPGYEAVGRVSRALPSGNGFSKGDWVFAPGASCYGNVRGLFGAAASQLVIPADRAVKLPDVLDGRVDSIAAALAATALHAIKRGGLPDLIIGHGALGRLAARIALAMGGKPVVWEVNDVRMDGDGSYVLCHPEADNKRDYQTILDLSGSNAALDDALAHACHGATIVLGGFYNPTVTFGYPAAFMREVQLVVAAEWAPADMSDIISMLDSGTLSFDGLISHEMSAQDAGLAYEQAFTDPACLKMTLDWREVH